MNFHVKQINLTTSVNLLNQPEAENEKVDLSPTFIFLATMVLVLLPLVNSFRNANNPKLRPHYWSQVPLLIRLNVYIIIITTLLPPLTVLGAILFALKTTVVIWLKLRHKDKFKGLLTGPDTLWTLQDPSTSIVNILLIVRHENASLLPGQVIKKLKEIKDDPEMWKLRCGYSSCMGYGYLLMKKNWHVGLPCVRKLDYAFYANREALQASLSELASVDIAGGNLWETFIGVEEIAWGNASHCYPVILRFHQVIGDHLALLQLVQRCFSLKSAEIINLPPRKTSKKKIEEHDSDNDFMQQLVKISIRLMHFIWISYKFPQALSEMLSKKSEENLLHNSKIRVSLSGEKFLVWKVENGYKYVNRIQKIKNKIGGAAFIDIICSAIGYSFHKFFKEKRENVKNLNVTIQGIPQSEKFTNMETTKHFKLTNRFSSGILKLPLENAKHRYFYPKIIANLYNLRTSLEFQLNYWLLHIVMGLIPRNLMKMILRHHPCTSTLLISNVPGPRRLEFNENECGESFVEDIVFWVPQRGLTGVTISIFTYDDRLQLGLSVDKIYKITHAEAEKILESIFEYIDRLYEELLQG